MYHLFFQFNKMAYHKDDLLLGNTSGNVSIMELKFLMVKIVAL